MKSLKALVKRARVHGLETVAYAERYSHDKTIRKKAVQMHKRGMSQNKIAVKLNVDHSTVRRWLQQDNMKEKPLI